MSGCNELFKKTQQKTDKKGTKIKIEKNCFEELKINH
jgi:hypothetical protein